MYIDKFNNFIKDNKLFSYKDKILLAVSGGRDSSVMTYLFKKMGFKFSIAHFNFMLRGNDSNLDEQFVANIASKYQVEMFVNRVDASLYAKQHNLSIQEAARELRYSWFLDLAVKYGYDYIATAHHMDDLVETMIINILRRTGISGIKGFIVKRDKVIRPMLCFNTNDIISISNLYNIDFRLDKSNLDDKYLRNRIRKYIVPNLYKVDVNCAESFAVTSKNVYKHKILLNDYIQKQTTSLLKFHEEYKYININDLKSIDNYDILLYEILRPFRVNQDTVNSIINSLNHNEPKTFTSDKFTIIKTRSKLIIRKNYFTTKQYNLDLYEHLSFNYLSYTQKLYEDIITNTNNNIAYLDSDKLYGDIKLRFWNYGDKMHPLGMQQQKNVSDILTDLKVDFEAKKNTMVLTHNGCIVWLVGYRINEKYKVDNNTNKVLKISKIQA